MIKPDEAVLISILNLQRSSDWDAFYHWMERCLVRSQVDLADNYDVNAMLRDQGQVRAFRFIVKHVDEARANYDAMRKNTA